MDTSWFHRLAPKLLGKKESRIPAGVWMKCKGCGETLYSKELEKNKKVCPTCEYHFILSAKERIDLLIDNGTFKVMKNNLVPDDPLKFNDTKKYRDRIKDATNKSGENEAIVIGSGNMGAMQVNIGAFHFAYMGGSMGSVVGEKITLLVEDSISFKVPLIIVSSSGGARMQEGIFSLMQMGKTSAAIAKLKKTNIPYISILTNPTTGGVTASFAMLGDVIIAEPKALIGFAGPRVIRETIKQELPSDFQTSEFLLENGSIDRVVHRHDLKEDVMRILKYLSN